MTSDATTTGPGEEARAERVDQLVAQGPAGVPGLLGMLTDPSWMVRRGVVAGLAALGDAAVVPLCDALANQRDNEARIAAVVDALSASSGTVAPTLVALVGHARPAVVADVAQVLGRRRDPAAVPILTRLLAHPDDNVAVAAIEALGRVGGRAAVEALIEAIRSGNFFRMFPAMDVLGRSGDPRAVEPLVALLPQASYAMEAARALGRTGERAALPPLARLLDAPFDVKVRAAALSITDLLDRFRERAGTEGNLEALLVAEAPAGAGRRLVQCLSGADLQEGMAICRVLGIIGGEDVVPALTQRLGAPPVVARCAAEALRRISREADTQLLEALRNGDSARRRALLPIISRSHAVYEVGGCLQDPDAEVRALACDALARLGHPAGVKPLFTALEDPNPRVSYAAAAAIQALGTAEARTLALQAARSDTPTVRRAALRILAYFGHGPALGTFLKALEDPDPRVRDAAISGLPFLEDKRAIEALFNLAKDAAPKVRGMALRALGQCTGDARIVAFLLKGLTDPDAWVRHYACRSLGKLAYAPAAPRLAALLSDEAGQVRVAAVEALSQLGTDEAHATLRRAAESAEPDMRRAALIGLGLCGVASDLPLLVAAAGSPDIATRLVALSALASFSGIDVVQALGRAAADTEEQVSVAAIGFLAARREPEATSILVRLLSSPTARDRALAALSVPVSTRAEALLRELETAGDEVAPLLTSTLAKLQRADALAVVFKALTLPNVAARKAAAETLAALGTADAVAALTRAAQQDPDPAVRQICTLLLAQ